MFHVRIKTCSMTVSAWVPTACQQTQHQRHGRHGTACTANMLTNQHHHNTYISRRHTRISIITKCSWPPACRSCICGRQKSLAMVWYTAAVRDRYPGTPADTPISVPSSSAYRTKKSLAGHTRGKHLERQRKKEKSCRNSGTKCTAKGG